MDQRPRSPIRIVPMRTAALASAAPPRLTYRGGPVLASPQVFLMFWGDAWRNEPQATIMGRLNDFFAFVLASPLMDQLAEYDVPGYTIGHGTRTGAVVVPATLSSTAGDSDVQQLVRKQIDSNPAIPRPTASSLYFVFLPPGVTAEMGGASSCVNFCGYHDNARDLNYAVMPYPDCDGCSGVLTTFDSLTATSSHELCEAITDPQPSGTLGWYDDANGEIGDICAWKTKELGGYTVQLEWSNKQGTCV